MEVKEQQPFLSLCMIVKDGERTLPALFESIKGLFDELIVVDTGSTDGTREIVGKQVGVFDDGETSWFRNEELAAGESITVVSGRKEFLYYSLLKFGWCDDFAAARNVAFEAARGKWRMYLDADDRIEFRGHQKHAGKQVDLKAIIQRIADRNPRVNTISMPYDYVDGIVREQKARIVRWEDGWNWRFPVHEQFYQHKGVRVLGQIADLHVVHDKTHEEGLASVERNARIIESVLEENSADPETQAHLMYHHATSYKVLGQYAKADEILISIEKTMESSTLWAYARRDRIQIAALFQPNIQAALQLAGGMQAQLPELRDGYLFVGWIQALKRDFARAAAAFDMAKARASGYPYVEDQWLTEGVVPAAQGLAYAHCGREAEAREVLDGIAPRLRHLEYVHDLYVEADRLCMRRMAYTRLMAHVDMLVSDSQPLDAIAALRSAPACVRDAPELAQRIRKIARTVKHLESWEKYKDAYTTGANDYHARNADVLDTERALTFLDWVDGLEAEGEKVLVLSIGSHDAYIEEAALEKNSRICFTVVDASELASEGTDRIMQKFPGRVTSAFMSKSDIDWPDDEYDAVICFEVIEHTDTPASQVIHELGRRLKDGGRLFLSTPIADRWVEAKHIAAKEPSWHVRALTPVSLWRMLEENLLTGSIVEGKDGTMVADVIYGPKNGPNITILVPSTPTPFDAVSPEHGFLGGSEEAVVRLARTLAKRGCRITVYAPEYRRASARLHAWDGVLWRTPEDFDVGAAHDTVIFWRCPQQVALYNEYAASLGDEIQYKRLLWLHDWGYFATKEQYDASDKIMSLSEHHDRCLIEDGAPKEKLVRFPNGIDEADFPPLDVPSAEFASMVEARDPHRVIYASSPERGLQPLLEMWDRVREAVPDATLDIFYDWTMARKQNPKRIEEIEARLEQLKESGVTYHGGVAQPTLHEAFRRAAVWAYPNGGKVETFCITAIKAQASGAWPVCTNAGALPEVVGRHGTLIPEDNMELFEASLIRTLKEPVLFEHRVEMREHALQFTWDAAATRLLSMIEGE